MIHTAHGDIVRFWKCVHKGPVLVLSVTIPNFYYYSIFSNSPSYQSHTCVGEALSKAYSTDAYPFWTRASYVENTILGGYILSFHINGNSTYKQERQIGIWATKHLLKARQNVSLTFHCLFQRQRWTCFVAIRLSLLHEDIIMECLKISL